MRAVSSGFDAQARSTAAAARASQGFGARTAALNRELEGQRRIMSDLSRAANAYQGSSGRYYAPGVRGSLRASDVEAYRAASRQVNALERSLAAIPAAQERAASSARAASLEADRAARVANVRAAEMAASHNLRQAIERRAIEANRVAQATSDRAALSALARNQRELARIRAAASMAPAVPLGMPVAPGPVIPPPSMLSRANAASIAGAERLTSSMMNASMASRYLMYDVSRNLALAGTGFLALGALSIGFAAKWEHAFAGVARTTGAVGPELEAIRQSLVGLSTSMPVSFTALSEIASLGAQMGIQTSGIAAYTSVIAKLTATTNLTGDAAGKALGRFQAFFSEVNGGEGDQSLAVSSNTFSNLASSILKVGVNSVATESGIVNVATQVSSMGSYAGMTADQVVGLAGAMSSVGVPPELSRGVITRLFTTMGKAVSENGAALNNFGKVAGVSGEEFKAAWGTEDFGHVFVDFIAGLNQIPDSAGGAVSALKEMGITGSRDVPVLMRLAGAANSAGQAGGLLAQTMNDARSGWHSNTELAIQYAKINDTVVSRLKVLGQAFEAMFASMGSGSLGPIKGLLSFMTDLVKGFASMGESAPVLANTLTGLSLVGGAVLLLAGAAARMGGVLAGFGQALTVMGVSAVGASNAVRMLGFAMGALGVVTAVAAIVGGIIALDSATRQSLSPVQNLSGALDAMKTDTVNGSGMTSFAVGAGKAATEAAAARDAANTAGEVLGKVEEKAYGAADGVGEVAGKMKEVSELRFGTASANFLVNEIAQSEKFINMWGQRGASGVGDLLKDSGLSPQEIAKAMAKDVDEAYAMVEEATGVRANRGMINAPQMEGGLDSPWLDDQQHVLGEYLAMFENGVGQMENAAGAAAVMGNEVAISFTSASQMTSDAMGEFALENEESISKIADGYKKFVDSGSLIAFTQKLKEVNALENPDERAAAAADWQKSWDDAYGGTAFSLEEYMWTFRAAAAEQESFQAGLQTLLGRGVDPAIISDLAAMGPQAAELVQAMVGSTDAALGEYVSLFDKTGYSAMVALATSQMAAQHLAIAVFQKAGAEGAREFSAALASGVSVEEALAKLGLDINGEPITVPLTPTPGSVDPALAAIAADIGVGIPGPIATPQAGPVDALIGKMMVDLGLTLPGPWINPQKGDSAPALGGIASEVQLPMAGPIVNPTPGDSNPALMSIQGYVNGNPLTGPKLNASAGNTYPALNSIQGTVNSNPVSGPTLNPVAGGVGAALGMMQGALLGRSLTVRINAVPGSVTMPNVPSGASFATGGYTGNGGKYAYAGDVHRGEFVMTKEATSRIGVGNLYALMRQASSRQQAPSVGFAGGGFTGGNAGSGSGYTELSPRDRALLERLGNLAVYLDGDKVSSSVAQRNFVSTRHGQG